MHVRIQKPNALIFIIFCDYQLKGPTERQQYLAHSSTLTNDTSLGDRKVFCQESSVIDQRRTWIFIFHLLRTKLYAE